MADNQLLEEFASTNPGVMQRRITDVFDQCLQNTDDEAIEKMLQEMTAVAEEAIDALSRD